MGNDVTSDSCSLSYNITEETTSDWIHTPVDTIITTIIIPIIVTIGIFSNTTFVFVIFCVLCEEVWFEGVAFVIYV